MDKQREEFEKVLKEYELEHLTGSSGLVRKIASHFYTVRQPEIDALETQNRRLSDDLEAIDKDTKALVDEIDALKAELRTLRDGIQTMGDALADGVWAHLISSDDDLNALDVGVSSVIGKLMALKDERDAHRDNAQKLVELNGKIIAENGALQAEVERLRKNLRITLDKTE